MSFKEWFYQSDYNEVDKPVVKFDAKMNDLLTEMEKFIEAAYEAGYEQAVVDMLEEKDKDD